MTSRAKTPHADPIGSGNLDRDRDRARRRFASRCLFLHLVCDDPKCRRRQGCARADAPCLRRYKAAYQDMLPALSSAVRRRLGIAPGGG
jgi:hypothetical protein